MKRIFSGHNMGKNSSSRPGGVRAVSTTAKYSGSEVSSRSASSSFSRMFSQGKEVSAMKASTPSIGQQWPNMLGTQEGLSPELVPIVTLLSAQGFRRYNDGMFLVLKDLKSDGSPAERVWREVYGVLIGTQLALWDPQVIDKIGCDEEQLAAAGCKPSYINFTDSTFKALTSGDAVTAAGKKRLTNTIAVSTTLKNRYFLQFNDQVSFERWHAAFRLSAFEFTALQEAYTGALLSTRGSLLSDIQVVLADTKFDYEEWVNVRFGAGMRWKRCYVVISQPPKKGKGSPRMGQISFYESEKKVKKAGAMATVTGARAAYAIYPSSPLMIDSSTMIKLEGDVLFPGSDGPKETEIFMMPELHSAVPGYDTIIRFLIPTMNAFRLYGRPESLSARKEDANSLLFGLPTLPHVHYLQVDDLLDAVSGKSSNWGVYEWRRFIKDIIKRKIDRGYTGCGSTTGLTGAISSPALNAQSVKAFPPRQSPQFMPTSRFASIDEVPSKNMRISSAPLLKSGGAPVRPPITSSTLTVIRDRMEGSSKVANAPPQMVMLDSLSETKVAAHPRLPMPPSFPLQPATNQKSDAPAISPVTSHTASSAIPPPYPVTEYEKSETNTISQDFINDRPLLPTKAAIPAPANNYEAFTRLAVTNEKNVPANSKDNEPVQRQPEIIRPDLNEMYERFTRLPLRLDAQDIPSKSSSMESEDIYEAYQDASVGNDLQPPAEGVPIVDKMTDGTNAVSNTLVDSVKDFILEEGIDSVDVMDDFYNLSKEISKLAAEGLASASLQEGIDSPSNRKQMTLPHHPKDPNVFDPDYVEEQALLMECDEKYPPTNSKLKMPSPSPLPSDSIFVAKDEYFQNTPSAFSAASKNNGRPAIVRSPGNDNINSALAVSHPSRETLNANLKPGVNQSLSPGRPPPPMDVTLGHSPPQQQYGGHRNPNMTITAAPQPDIHQNLPRQQVNWQVHPNTMPSTHARPQPPTVQHVSDRMRGKSPIGSVGSVYTQPTDNSRSASFFSSNSYARQPQNSLSPMASTVSPTTSSVGSNVTAK